MLEPSRTSGEIAIPSSTFTAGSDQNGQGVALRMLVILSALMSLASVATDMYLPALPTLVTQFHTRTDRVELTISTFLVGFSVGQLVWGPLSDRVGRRAPVAAGMVLFVLGSIGCAASTSVDQMLGWRVVQALGACAGPVLARAMVRDLYARSQAAKMLSVLILMMAVAPLIGPLLGGQMLHIWSWPSIFWAMALFGGIALSSLIMLPETLPVARRTNAPMRVALASYGPLLRDSRFLGASASGAFFYAGAYALIAGTPFAYVDYYHVATGTYGVLFGINIVGLMGINFLNTRLVERFGSDRVFQTGAIIVAVSGIALALDARFGWGGLVGLLVPVFVYMSMNGLIVANSVAHALEAFPERAGAASSLVGATQYGSGIFSAALVGWLADGTPSAMGEIAGVAGLACAVTALRKSSAAA